MNIQVGNLHITAVVLVVGTAITQYLQTQIGDPSAPIDGGTRWLLTTIVGALAIGFTAIGVYVRDSKGN